MGGRFDANPGVLLALGGLIGTAAPVGWWTWIAYTQPDDVEAGGGLMVAVVQLAMWLSAGLGGLIFDRFGHQTTVTISAVTLLGASVLA